MADEQLADEAAPSFEIELVFSGMPPTALLVTTIQVCEEELNQIQRAEMDAALEALGLPGYVKSVCRRRFDDSPGVSLRLVDARRGSVVLVGALTAIAFWIIKNTVGETIKDAYKETGMHERLKQLFLTRIGDQARDLESALTGRLVRRSRGGNAQVFVKAERRRLRTVVVVSVAVSEDSQQSLPPTMADWLGSDV